MVFSFILFSFFQANAQNIVVDLCPGEMPSAFLNDSAITGGVGPFTYLWQTSVDSLSWNDAPGQNDSTSYIPILSFSDTTFIRRAVIDQSCNDTAFSNAVLVRVPKPIQANEIISSISCFGANDGVISLGPSGGTMPYSFSWNTGDTLNNLAALQPGSYSVTLTDVNGCEDSTSFLLTEPAFPVNSQTVEACESFTWLANGATYLSSGIYQDTLQTSKGCDSAVTLNLTIDNVDMIVSQTGTILNAVAGQDSYQWIDCLNGNTPITGATNESYTATQNGEYAVIITNGICEDTSACLVINGISVSEVSTSLFDAQLIPNPNNGQFLITLFGEHSDDVQVDIRTINGAQVFVSENRINASHQIPIDVNLAQGSYFLRLISKDQVVIKHFIVR